MNAVRRDYIGAEGVEVPSTAIGLVMAAQANFVRIKVDHLESSDDAIDPPRLHLLCVVRALLKKIRKEVLVGDRVLVVGIDWASSRGMVEDVLPRESRLLEPPVANVNHVLLVFSLDRPPLQPSAATRYLVAAEAAGLPITVALNKSDLLTPEEVETAVARVSAWGYQALAVSVVEEEGMTQLETALKERVTVLAGPSGAGKSSIINAIKLRSAGLGADIGAASSKTGDIVSFNGSVSSEGVELQAVGEVSERIGRGKHTTRNVTLMQLGTGGLVVDTPGFNQPSLSLPPNDLGNYFPEVRAALQQDTCAFSNCQHMSEPGCVVRGDWERYELYIDLHAEMRLVQDEASKRADAKKKREGAVRFKTRAGGQIGLEARLESKSYRRISRRSVKQKLSELVKDVEDDDGMP